MKWLVVLIVCPYFEATGRCAEEWLYQEKVTYLENHDPSMVYLADERQLSMKFDDLSRRFIDQWPRGKEVMIAYNSGKGTVLLDPSSGNTIPVLGGLDEHPLDTMWAARDPIGTEDTMGFIGVEHDFDKLWDKEMKRALKVLADSMDRKARVTLKSSQAAWKRFREREVKMLVRLHDRPGTIQGMLFASNIRSLTRGRALQLNSYLSDF